MRRVLHVAQRQQAVKGALARLEDGGLDGALDLLDRDLDLGRKRGARRMPLGQRRACPLASAVSCATLKWRSLAATSGAMVCARMTIWCDQSRGSVPL